MLNGLGLFEGIGGLSLGLKEWVQTVAYCELDPYCQAVLLSRMADGLLPEAPIWDDIKTLKGNEFPPRSIDIIYGGFPCQDLSIAGTKKGLEGERSGLFFEIIRLVSEVRPSFVFLENVPMVTVLGLERICMEFTALRYDCRWTIVSAGELGAQHKRERWFLLAHTSGERLERQFGEKPKKQMSPNIIGKEWFAVEPNVDRVAHGIQFRPYRIKSLGNAVVPIQAKEAFRRLSGL